MTTEPTYIVQAPIQGDLRDRVTVAVRHGSGIRKIVKLAFRNKTADLYAAFPYVNVPSFRAGIVQSTGETQTYSTAPSDTMLETHVTIKLSLHESGVVHCKAQDNAAHGGTTLARKHSVPFAQLRGHHVLTIEAEEIGAFEEATAEEAARRDFVLLDVPPDCERVKITAYAGYRPEEVAGKIVVPAVGPLPASVSVRFVRPSLDRPLYVGFYVVGGGTLQQGTRQPGILVLAAMDTGPESSFMVIHGNDPSIA